MDYSLPGFSVHGIFHARVLEWVAISFTRGSSQPRDRTQVSLIVSRRFTLWATREAHWHSLFSFLGTRVINGGKEPTCQCRRNKRHRFDPWVRKIPWRKVWQPTPVFLSGEWHGERSLTGYGPWGHKVWDMTEVTQHSTQVCENKLTKKWLEVNRNPNKWNTYVLSHTRGKKVKKSGLFIKHSYLRERLWTGNY